MPGPLKRLLIADDHEAIRRGVRSFIETKSEWRVVGEASNGRDALEEARRTMPSIAILDYSLPLLNGLEVTLALKREFPRIEILIYTMHEREDILMNVLNAGARGFVLKTDPQSHLISAIEALAMRQPYFSGGLSETMLDHFLQKKPDAPQRHALTAREREIVQLIAEGKINKKIAELLGISVKTVETHRAAVMHKLDLKTVADLVRYAIRNDLTQP